MDRISLIYFDSSVWLSYLLQDRHYSKADKSLRRIEQGNDTALVSTLVLLEIIEVIRKRIVENEVYTGLTSSAIQSIKTKIDEKTREFIDKVTKLSKQNKVKVVGVALFPSSIWKSDCFQWHYCLLGVSSCYCRNPSPTQCFGSEVGG